MPSDRLQRRLNRLRGKLRRNKLDALLVNATTNVRYMSGFTGEDSWLVVGREGAALLTDSRFTEQAEAECPHCEVIRRKGPLRDACVRYLEAHKLRAVGFEADSLAYNVWESLRGGGLQWQPTTGMVENLRLTKDAAEVKSIRRAVTLAENCFQSIREWIRPGMTEAEVAAEIEIVLRRLGADGSSFEPIVLFGERSSLPHGRPSSRRLRPGDAVLIDMGARLDQYNSDLTRMLLPSTMGAKLRRIYRAVLEAQQAALDAARPGMTAGGLDAVARDCLAKARLARRFGHGLGHGVGMEIHEGPALARSQAQELRPGMVFTIEPGVYIPGWGGVRIEDMVQLTSTGRRVLTSLPRELEQACVL